MLKMQAIDIKLLTGNWRAKNRLHRVGGVGVGGFFGEETAKLGRGNGRGWRDGIRVEDEFLVMGDLPSVFIGSTNRR